MTRGFKNFLGIALACIALSALFSSPVGFFDVVVAVMCIIAAILLLKPTESEKAAKKAKQSGNESKSMPTANTTDTAIETVKPTQITTQNEGYCHEPEPPVKPIVEHYSRNDDVEYREANQRAGYVYVISNIGAFGENVYKIGMTRRLDPMDRIDELGDASVPFKFDVHAMIFSDGAPKLEAALHNAFADKKLNFVNQRREFFNVSLEEIKQVVRDNFDKSVEFVEIPPAEQYRESLLLREASEVHA